MRFWSRKKKTHQPGKAGVHHHAQGADDEEADQWANMQSDSLILVMGVTGAGKSYFINQLKPNSVAEGHGIRSETRACKLVQMQIGACTVAAVDTPGFDDDDDSDAVVLAKITHFLITQYRLGIPLKGIIFLHSITTIRFSGSHKRYLDTFRQICGDDAFKNVALVTTMWHNEKQAIGLRREAELQTGPWSDLKAKGADVFQYNGTADMAQAIVGRLMMKPDVELKIQKELLKNPSAELNSTTAGAGIASQIERKLQATQQEIQTLTVRIEEAEAARDTLKARHLRREQDKEREKQLKQMKSIDALRPKIFEETGERIEEVDSQGRARGQRKSKLQIFVSVLGMITGLTFSLILPLAGVSIGS
ncbi:hypothetical protein C7974DRAFT_185147 [Boeremia exigua]|uniref:uncharacterized protein n=1 Tax=Boeremia exigua TaxID=749465 RepID=UPI001E8E28F7|nr:uncharacterized protein C7974DRAFT_185147 [Boeremia exigua]KAH6629362.1 hypothetical protein C7974DRAFT_185147 [Boeremia exigua]